MCGALGLFGAVYYSQWFSGVLPLSSGSFLGCLPPKVRLSPANYECRGFRDHPRSAPKRGVGLAVSLPGHHKTPVRGVGLSSLNIEEGDQLPRISNQAPDEAAEDSHVCAGGSTFL